MRKSIVVAIAFALSGCAAAPVASDCLLGQPEGRELLAQESWGDPVDTLIAQSFEEGDGWQCPAAELPAHRGKSLQRDQRAAIEQETPSAGLTGALR